MAQRRISMGREIGTAFAVLALYVLTLLLPMHQAAGLQRDLERMGFETLTSWSVCAPLAQDDPAKPQLIKCPAAGVAKHDFAALLPGSIDIGPARIAVAIDRVVVARLDQRTMPEHFGQSRAPPVAA